MKFGYARVSTSDQNLDGQISRLENYGVDKIFSDKLSGRSVNRPQLSSLLNYLRKDDLVVVTNLDRLSRSLSDTISIIEEFHKREAHFITLDQSIDTSGEVGRFQLHVFAAIAEYQREQIASRTKLGLEQAKANGVQLGRPPALTNEQIDQAIILYEKKHSFAYIARLFNVAPNTIKNAINRRLINGKKPK